MANTYVLIASSTVGLLGSATIDFTSIPSTYTDLLLLTSVRSSDLGVRAALNITVNGSASTYSSKLVRGYDNTTVDSASGGSTSINTFRVPATGNTASTFSNDSTYIPNYAGSTNKSMSLDNTSESNISSGTTNYLSLSAGLWSTTSAINQVTLTLGAGNFVQYSTAYLYGVKNA
jgi:hypothetical protein